MFLFERSHVQTKRKYFVYKEMQSLRIFLMFLHFFSRKKITRVDYRIFRLQRISIFPMHKFYIDFQKCTLYIFYSIGNLQLHENFSTYY